MQTLHAPFTWILGVLERIPRGTALRLLVLPAEVGILFSAPYFPGKLPAPRGLFQTLLLVCDCQAVGNTLC